MKRAFTLIELLVVILIMGVLASLITGNFFTSLKKGRDAKRKTDLEQIQRSLEMYYEDKRTYPTFNIFATAGYQLCETKIADSCAALTPPEKVYMIKLPDDPISGKHYEYINTAGADYKLFACLENNLQILPYVSTGYSITCGNCKKPDGVTDTPCIWGVSSSNITP